MMTASVLASQPLWSYIMMWPDQITQNGNPSILATLFQADQVLKRAQMPGWY